MQRQSPELLWELWHHKAPPSTVARARPREGAALCSAREVGQAPTYWVRLESGQAPTYGVGLESGQAPTCLSSPLSRG